MRRRRRSALVTTTPDPAPPQLFCPTCVRLLEYRQTVISGVQPIERWDYFDCRCAGRLNTATVRGSCAWVLPAVNPGRHVVVNHRATPALSRIIAASRYEQRCRAPRARRRRRCVGAAAAGEVPRDARLRRRHRRDVRRRARRAAQASAWSPPSSTCGCGAARAATSSSRRPPDVPVIIFSGVPSESAELERLRPRTRLIEKPYSLVLLVETLEEMLAESQTCTRESSSLAPTAPARCRAARSRSARRASGSPPPDRAT